MPFTPSHALVALPFVRTPLVPAAIAIGTMTPDLPLFVRGVGLNYAFLHSNANIVWTMLLALVLYLVWRVVLRPAAGELMPDVIASRLPADWSERGIAAANRALGVGSGRRMFPFWLAISVLLGVASHILWDSFTHEGRWGVHALPVLDEMWGPLPGYKWLQHGSSVIALVILGIAGLIWLIRRAPVSVTRHAPRWVRVVWWLSLPVLLVAAWVFGLVAFGPLSAEFTVQHLAYRVLPPACALWGVLTLVLCAVLSFRRPAHQVG